MAKLADITLWIERMLGGDAPRARSLVQVARKADLFTKGGRGPGAPEMTPQDASVAILLALYDGPPTECHHAVRALSRLPLVSVDIAPNGPREDGHIRLSGDDTLKADMQLPAHFKVCPQIPLEALIAVLSHSETPYHLDAVRITKGAATTNLYISLFDPEKEIESDLESERDLFQFDMHFFSFDAAKGEYSIGRQSEFSFSGNELHDLYCLIHGLDPDQEN